MNLVEAVNMALGTNGKNLQGALNEAAGVDASNITEAISKIEGGGGGAVIPTITLLTMPSESTRGTYSSDVPYDDMRNAIRNSAYINNYMRSVIPIYVAFDGAEAGSFISAHLDSQGNISLGVNEETTYVFYEDGTFEIVGLSHRAIPTSQAEIDERTS